MTIGQLKNKVLDQKRVHEMLQVLVDTLLMKLPNQLGDSGYVGGERKTLQLFNGMLTTAMEQMKNWQNLAKKMERGPNGLAHNVKLTNQTVMEVGVHMVGDQRLYLQEIKIRSDQARPRRCWVVRVAEAWL